MHLIGPKQTNLLTYVHKNVAEKTAARLQMFHAQRHKVVNVILVDSIYWQTDKYVNDFYKKDSAADSFWGILVWPAAINQTQNKEHTSYMHHKTLDLLDEVPTTPRDQLLLQRYSSGKKRCYLRSR